jgi:predicted MFS family arabinose efflux permease
LFLINIPFGLVAFVLARRVLPRSATSDTGGRFDATGFASIAVGLSALVYGLGEFGSRGSVSAPTVWISVVVGVLALGLFVARSVRGRGASLLDVGLFRHPVFATANVASFFAGASMFGAMLVLPLYFQVLHRDGLVATGLLLMSFGLGGIIAMPIGGRLTDRYGGGVVAVVGTAVTVAVSVPFALGDASMNPVVIQALLLIRGMATGLTGMPIVAAAYASVRPEQIPDAASFVNILQRVGGSIGAALLAVVLYRAADAGLPVDAGFRQAFWWITAAAVVSLVASVLLWRKEIQQT